MTRIFNVAALKERRRVLRNNQTPAEKIMWEKLRKKQLFDIQFHRQYGIGPYIADFYAPGIRLCIEIDGEYHKRNEVKIYDKERDDFMNALEIKVLRVPNENVLNEIENVVEVIKNEIMKTIKNPSAVSLITKGEHKNL